MSEPEKDINCYQILFNYNKIMLWLINESVSLGLISQIKLFPGVVTQTKPPPNVNYNLDMSTYISSLSGNLSSEIINKIINPTVNLLTDLINKVNDYNNKNTSNIIVNSSAIPKENQYGIVNFNVEFSYNPSQFLLKQLASRSPTPYSVGLYLGSNINNPANIKLAKSFTDCGKIWESIYKNLPDKIKNNSKITNTLDSMTTNEGPVDSTIYACARSRAADETAEPAATASIQAKAPRARLRELLGKAARQAKFDRTQQKRLDKITNPTTGGKKSHKRRKGKKVRKTKKGKKIKKSRKVHKIKKARKSRK